MTRTTITVTTFAAALLATPGLGDVIQVPLHHPTIQEAIDAAENGDEIRVDLGTYEEQLDFLGKHIVVRSLHGAALTTLSYADASVVTFSGGENHTTELRGFTIEAGNEFPLPAGGGIYIEDASPTIRGCSIVGGRADYGGAAAVYGDARPLFRECLFVDNLAYEDGGAVYADCDELTLIDCAFAANSGDGGVLYMRGNLLDVRGCSVTDNETIVPGAGGGFNLGSTVASISDTQFVGNRSEAGSGGAIVGGSGEIRRCLFLDNGSDQGGVFAFSDFWCINCVFNDNNAFQGAVADESDIVMTNCTVVNNGNTWPSSSGAPGSSNNIFWNNDEGVGALPGDFSVVGENGFVDADGPDDVHGTADDNLRLRADSSAVDTADNAALPPDLLADFDKNHRFRDDPAAGTPDGEIVDAGAYERQPGDATGDGRVDTEDLLLIFASWGPCGGCPADLTGDGQVNSDDLLIVLAFWQ